MTTAPPKCAFCDKDATLETLRNDGSGQVWFRGCVECTKKVLVEHHKGTGHPILIEFKRDAKKKKKNRTR